MHRTLPRHGARLLRGFLEYVLHRVEVLILAGPDAQAEQGLTIGIGLDVAKVDSRRVGARGVRRFPLLVDGTVCRGRSERGSAGLFYVNVRRYRQDYSELRRHRRDRPPNFA